MRAKEFIISEKTGSLANMIRQAVVSQQGKQMGQPAPQDRNQMKTGVQPQTSVGSVSPTQASATQQPSGGTQTPQNGTNTTEPAKKPGVMGSFISGMTGGQASSLGSLAKMGAAKAAGSAGLGSVQKSIDQSRVDKEVGMGNQPPELDPRQLMTTLKPGTQLDHPELGKLKINKVTPQGIEIDASQSPELGMGKITLDLKSLAQKKV
jgi:hypothetical protein